MAHSIQKIAAILKYPTPFLSTLRIYSQHNVTEDENLNPNQLEPLNYELHTFSYELFHKQPRRNQQLAKIFHLLHTSG
jgi:hypothetical protein